MVMVPHDSLPSAVKLPELSDRLLLLMNAAKNGYNQRSNTSYTNADIGHILSQLYHPNLNHRYAMYHCFKAYEEAVCIRQFEMPYSSQPSDAVFELLMVPIKNHPTEILTDLQSTFTIKQYYETIINSIMNLLLIARVDWCKDQIEQCKTKYGLK